MLGSPLQGMQELCLGQTPLDRWRQAWLIQIQQASHVPLLQERSFVATSPHMCWRKPYGKTLTHLGAECDGPIQHTAEAIRQSDSAGATAHADGPYVWGFHRSLQYIATGMLIQPHKLHATGGPSASDMAADLVLGQSSSQEPSHATLNQIASITR